MDESLKELEQELKSLRPRSIPGPMMSRLERELCSEPAKPVRFNTSTNWTSWKWAALGLGGLAAAVALVSLVSVRRQPEPPAGDETAPIAAQPVTAVPASVNPATVASVADSEVYRPVRAATVLYDLQDEGPVKNAGDLPARQARFRYVDSYTWQNSRGNASVRWSVPRDEIRVVPVSLH